MERQNFENKKLIVIVLAIFYLVGIFIHLNSVFSILLKILTPLFLLMSSALVIFEEKPSKQFLIWISLSYLITLIIEIIGVKTGLIFGSYSYGKNLGVKLFDVPLIIGLNWVVLILASIGFVEKINTSIYLKSFLVGIIMVVFDLLLEMSAPRLDYWVFDEEIVPVQNFLLWFIISYALSYFYFNFKVERSFVVARFNLLFQFIFFLLIVLMK